MPYGSQAIFYAGIRKADSLDLNLRCVTEKKHAFLILSLFAVLSFISITVANAGAVTNASEIAPQVKSNLSSAEQEAVCPTDYLLDVESGLCVYGYTYCPDGVTLYRTAPTECDSSLVGNTTSDNTTSEKTQVLILPSDAQNETSAR
jgi:hypothetical protein